MIKQGVILFISWWAFINTSRADIVPPGHINRQFMFTNLDKFPAYKFYYIEHTYRYDHGYKSNTPDTVPAENNQWYFASHRGSDKTFLLARDVKGKKYRSEIQIGGPALVGAGIGLLVDVYCIISIKNSVIKLRKTKEITQNESGKQTERKIKGGFPSFLAGDDLTAGMIIVSFVALVFLTGLILGRKKKVRSVALAT